jgi:CHAT domain-containing protein/cytochrome c-type biogenesis protein CcmH/NrfG
LNENPAEHIDATELARMAQRSRSHPESAPDAADLHPHLGVCATCRDEYEGLVILNNRLSHMRSAGPVLRRGDCPGPGVWREIAAGLTSSDQTLIHIEHASCCEACGPLLRKAVSEMADLKGEITDAEQKRILSLESASVEWQRKLAHRIASMPDAESDRELMASRSKSWWRYWVTVPRLVFVGGTLAVAVAVGSWIEVQRHQAPAAERLLARAYTEKRTLELRIAGADYAPLRVSLGPVASFTSRPPALLKAEALIGSQLQSHPADPAWLEAKAQADLLEGKYDAAVESLRRGLEIEPNTPVLLVDLATAYFQRALQEDRKEDLGAAYETLSQALKLRPDDPVALFNRAIVAEHQFLYLQARDDWEHYLRVDSGSEWAEEARNRADAVREKLKQHESKAVPLLSPEQFVASARHNDAASGIDDRIDEYLNQAVRSWIPAAFPRASATANTSASQALFFLAKLTAQKHGDPWLSDLLRGSSAPSFAQAARALSLALHSNEAGQYDAALTQASLAEKLFRGSGNTAGVLRAEFEQLFAIQLLHGDDDCRPRATTALEEAEKTSYVWLQIQLGLEKAVCSFSRSDTGADEKATDLAMRRAQKNGYGALYLRAAMFSADDKNDVGDLAGAIALADAGLERYWSGEFPPVRGYSLYAELAEVAGSAGASQPILQVALWREAVALVDLDEEPLERAMAHKSMADASISAGLSEIAEQNYAEAGRLFAAAPRNNANRAAALEAEIRTARTEAQLGQFDDAIARLTRIQDQIGPHSEAYISQAFYSTLGELQLGRHRESEAEQAYRPALRLAEQKLASLTSETERASWGRDAAPVYLGLAEAELLEGREQDSLNMFEWYMGASQRIGVRGRDGAQASRRPTSSFPDPNRLGARLPLLVNETVLAYGVLPDGLAIWVYDNRGVSAAWIPKSSQDLQDLASAFYAKCAQPDSDASAVRRDGEKLYSLLIAPIEQRLDSKRTLVIEAEGFLARLPFEALVDPNGHYLVQRGSIVHSPGPYAEARMHAEATITRDSPALIVGSDASSPDAGLFVIPDIAAGADAIARDFHASSELKGSEATLAAVTKGLSEATVFHYAGHATDNFRHTGLLLQNGRASTSGPKTARKSARSSAHSGTSSSAPVFLDAKAVRSLDLQKMQLALLAACSTDAGVGGSRGLDSVAQALQTSGVPHVVASRWTVDSVEARVFASGFYTAVFAGEPVSGATRMMSQRMMSNPQTAHPFYWAAFAAYGRP